MSFYYLPCLSTLLPIRDSRISVYNLQIHLQQLYCFLWLGCVQFKDWVFSCAPERKTQSLFSTWHRDADSCWTSWLSEMAQPHHQGKIQSSQQSHQPGCPEKWNRRTPCLTFLRVMGWVGRWVQILQVVITLHKMLPFHLQSYLSASTVTLLWAQEAW